MSLFSISFRIGDNGDHSSRWSSLVEQIRMEAAGATTWKETTSFFLLQSTKTAESLASALYLKSSMNADWDKLLVVNLSSKEYATRGKIQYPETLTSLMAAR